jgi:hypothetical protein
MLWYKLLQNTIYCGTLHLTSYQLYEYVSLGGLIDFNKETGGKRYKKEDIVLCPLRQHSAATLSVPTTLMQATKLGGGLVWIALLLP